MVKLQGMVHPTQHPHFSEFGDVSHPQHHFARRSSLQHISSTYSPAYGELEGLLFLGLV